LFVLVSDFNVFGALKNLSVEIKNFNHNLGCLLTVYRSKSKKDYEEIALRTKVEVNDFHGV
jgi:hypothetical protein